MGKGSDGKWKRVVQNVNISLKSVLVLNWYVYGEHAKISSTSLSMSTQKKAGKFYFKHLRKSKRKLATENDMRRNENSLIRG